MTLANVEAERLHIGKNSVIEPSAKIRGLNRCAKSIWIGDNVYIGEDVQIICDDFYLGDYSKLQHHVNVHGYKPCHIGHNAWIGQFTIIDSIGSVTIGNNCGVGAHSQLWSHIKYGDTLEGCRFLSEQPMVIGHDVWFVGHCIVSPIIAADKSMALVGSVVTRDMDYNQIYAGAPAKSVSDKLGYQFEQVLTETKYQKLLEYRVEWSRGKSADGIVIVREPEEVSHTDDKSYFVAATRQYTKKLTDMEISFMKFLLPSRAKFVPFE